ASRSRSADRNGGRRDDALPGKVLPGKVLAPAEGPVREAWEKSIVGIRRRAITINEVAPPGDPRKQSACDHHAAPPATPRIRARAESRVASALAKHRRT